MPDEEFADLQAAVDRWNKRQQGVMVSAGKTPCDVCGAEAKWVRPDTPPPQWLELEETGQAPHCCFCGRVVCNQCFEAGKCCDWVAKD